MKEIARIICNEELKIPIHCAASYAIPLVLDSSGRLTVVDSLRKIAFLSVINRRGALPCSRERKSRRLALSFSLTESDDILNARIKIVPDDFFNVAFYHPVQRPRHFENDTGNFISQIFKEIHLLIFWHAI